MEKQKIKLKQTETEKLQVNELVRNIEHTERMDLVYLWEANVTYQDP